MGVMKAILFGYAIDKLRRVSEFLEIVSDQCPCLPRLLDTTIQMTVGSQKTAREVLLIQFRLFIDPNLMEYDEGTTDLNMKHIDQFIKRLQEVYFPEDHPVKGQRGRIGVAAEGKATSVKKKVIDVVIEEDVASIHHVRIRKKPTPYGSDFAEEDIPSRPLKR